MLTILLLLLTTQAACAPQEGTAVCACKHGSASACEVLRQVNPNLADSLESAFQIAAKVEQEQKTAASSHVEAEPSCDSSTPVCKGQLHHIISRPIADALDGHATLHGHYKPRDPRFVSRAVDEKAHCGYQQWHRDVDKEVINWLANNKRVTPKQFEDFLREIYSREAMRARFPHGF